MLRDCALPIMCSLPFTAEEKVRRERVDGPGRREGQEGGGPQATRRARRPQGCRHAGQSATSVNYSVNLISSLSCQ